MAAAPQRHRQPCCLQLLQTLPQAWKRDAQQGRRKLERSLSQLSFSSAWWCAVIYDTLSLDPHWLPAPPHHHLSHTNSLSALVSCHMTCKSPACNYISKQTGKNALIYDQFLNETVTSSFTPSVPVRIFPSWSAYLFIFNLLLHISSHSSGLSTRASFDLSFSQCLSSLCSCVFAAATSPPPSLHPHTSLFLFSFHFLSEGKSLHHSLTGHSQSPSVSDSRCWGNHGSDGSGRVKTAAACAACLSKAELKYR